MSGASHRPRHSHGLLVQFKSPESLIKAAGLTRAAGYRRLDAYSPFPVEGLDEAIGFTRNRIPLVVLIGGLAGGIVGYIMQWYSTVVDYPINVGGRPFHSWPMFIPITFELTILGAAFAAVMGMLALNGLPRPHHPVFAAKGFERASSDRFFLSVHSDDPLFEPEASRAFLQNLDADPVDVVEY